MPLADWAAVIAAAGFDLARMTPEQVYETAGLVIHDPVITERKLAIGHTIPTGTTLQLLKAMTPVERQQLRERVSRKVVPITRKRATHQTGTLQ